MGSSAVVTTRVVGFRKVMARRRTDVVLSDGSLAAWAFTDWVMTDAVRAIPTRVPPDFPGQFDAPPVGFDPIRVDPPVTPVEVTTRALTVRPQELDPMAHANNAVYVDWMEEAVRDDGGAPLLATLPRTYRLEYLASAAPAQELLAEAWTEDGRAWHHVLRAAAPPIADPGSGRPGDVLLRGSLAAGGEA
jgi:acyl-CoA thioesterase FadM